jgi:hypothetical protein
MPFEVFSSGSRRPAGAPAVSIQPSGVLRLNYESAEILKRARASRVLVLWDGERRKLAIQPVNSADPRAYRLTFNARGNMASIAAKSFARSIGWAAPRSVKMPAEWVDGMLQAKVPVEHLKDSRLDSPRTRKKKADF